ncbi:MFS transporter [Pseudomonas alcaligenes]|uniref:MFS transporter n=1 Tax=Aquipseudomonas alcaligenes TaxID=43263 RepID=A0ABR7RUL6_AQUAC|nr:MFS transporter [Pseudomonas alcaligenes]MBC9248861.1 MFS transporter [Pseudomonas alcaligenes]
MHPRTLLSLPLLALALGGFVVGSSEFIIMGLLPEVAADLNVSLAAAGLLVSAYAMGVVIGAPLLGPLLGRLPHKQALLWLMGSYALGNLGCALAPDYHWLIAMRMLTAVSHAGFFGCATLLAAELAPLHRRASAMALVLSGLTIANVLGVPLGAWLGQASSWRVTFAVVALIGLLALLAQALWLPRMPAPPRNAGGAWSGILRLPVLHALLVCCLSSVALFGVFTYISPLLRDVGGFSASHSNAALLLFGIGLTLGNLLGGRLADKGVRFALPLAFGGSALCLLGLYLCMDVAPLVLALLFAWGVASFAISSPLQLLLVEQAGESASLAATLSHAAFNLGNASGAYFGGLWLSINLGLGNLPLLGVGLLALAILVSLPLPRLRATRERFERSH